MKKTKSAVKYGMETLKLSPDELFKLIESSQGYDGSDYARWLAGKIISVAEEDRVQFSQLLVKKFNIINEILEEVSENQEISEEFLDIFKSVLHRDLYSIDLDCIGEPLNIDWYNGLDLNFDNSFFVMEKLPVEVRNKILENEKLSMLFRLSLDSADKKSDLYIDAKGQGLNLTSKGALILYRLCNMASSFDLSNVKFGVLVPVKFLYDKDNEGVIDYLLSYFKIEEGYSIKSVEMSLNALNAGSMAFITLSVRDSDEDSDGVTLTSITLDKEELCGFAELETSRYSKSSRYMVDKIEEDSYSLVDDVMMENLGEPTKIGKGLKDALGYLNIGNDVSLTTLPEENKRNIAITKKNIKDVIAYYGVVASREIEWGSSPLINCFIDGREGFEELLYNCLPLFLFDSNSNFSSIGGTESRLSLESEVVKELLDVGAPYFSFEAKELFNTCRDFMKSVGSLEGESFRGTRTRIQNDNFNVYYETKLVDLKEYINLLSKNYL